MMDKELLIAFLSVDYKPYSIRGGRNRPSEHWSILFNYYNSFKPEGERPLGMSCQPCYDKVYQYCKHSLLAMAMNEPKRDSGELQRLLDETHATQMNDVKIPGEN
jgi:hypothetical protein